MIELTDLKEKLINEISIKNSILKLLSAWFLFAVCLVLSGTNHSDLSFFQSLNIFIPIISIIGIFALLYALSIVLYKYKIDSKALFIISTIFITALIINFQTDNINIYKLLGLVLVFIMICLYCFYDNKYLKNNHICIIDANQFIFMKKKFCMNYVLNT